MRETRTRRHLSLFALLLALAMLAGLAPAGAMAQNPVPAQPAPAGPTTEPAPGLPEGYTPPPQLAGLSAEDLASLQFPRQVSGPVSINVAVSPTRFTAPQELTYTFSYQNNSGAAATGIRIHVTFSKWVKTAGANTDPERIWQFCADTMCNPENVQGSAVTRLADITGGVAYRVADLPNGASGSFQLRLKVPNNVYPVVTNSEPRRPASSAQLFLNDNTGSVVSENSVAAVSEAPVFQLNKTKVGTNAQLYPLDVGEFLIRLQNIDRDDSVTARNIVLTDVIPTDGTYVPGDGDLNPQQVTVGGKPALRWNIPGPLPKGGSIEIRVRFRRNDGPPRCGALRNVGTTLTATSDEMPLKPGSQTDRFTVASRDNPSYATQVPIVVAGITAEPGVTPFGAQTSLTIKVRNYWPQPIVDGRLTYTIQGNATYLVGSATGAGSPQVVQEPPGSSPGGTLIWRLDMPAGSITQPSEKTFSLSLRGGFSTTGRGTAVVSVPQGVPGGCLEPLQGQARLIERLEIGKYTDVERVGNTLYARDGDNFPYYIKVTNNGPDPVDNVRIVDFMPSQNGANFSYNNDATLDDAPLSATWNDGSGGRIEWSPFRVEPGQTRYIRYTTRVDGIEFQSYCNQVGESDIEQLLGEEVRVVQRSVCIRINPDIDLTKELVDPADANIQGPLPAEGREVKFRLRLTNNDIRSYQMALYDALPPTFSFVGVESSTASGPPTLNERGDLEWALQSVPVGGTIEAVIITRFNPPCARQTYRNELKFKFRNDQGEEAVYVSVPRSVAQINYLCGTNVLEYRQRADRDVASLADEVTYTLTVANKNVQNVLQNVSVVNILPPGFTFIGMANAGAGAGAPQIDTSRADGRIKLTWTVPQIAVSGSAVIAFKARTSNVVNQDYRSWTYATAPELLSAICRGERCETVQDGGQEFTFAYDSIEVRPLHTYTPQILAGDTVEECANAGVLRNYRLSLVNTNIHAYTSTAVTATLPLGLHFVRPIAGTPNPRKVALPDGGTQLIWSDLTVPKKPDNSPLPAELRLEVELEIGQVWSDMPTLTSVTSPDGLIPLADNVLDPTVKICQPAGPAIAKDASLREVRSASAAPNQEFLYQIEVVNPTAESLTLSVEDQLPANVAFVAQLRGPNPTRSGNTLTWQNLTVQGASGGAPGVLKLLFTVRVVGGDDGDEITNTARVLTSSLEVDDSLATIGVDVRQQSSLYLPLVIK